MIKEALTILKMTEISRVLSLEKILVNCTSLLGFKDRF